MSTTCPTCRSEKIHWLLHREHDRGAQRSRRTLSWQCRSCGHEWSVPLEEAPELAPPTPPAG